MNQQRQILNLELLSWAGGGVRSLTWEDGVKTFMTFGLIGRGGLIGPACKNSNETDVDGVCGKDYVRDARALKRISEAQRAKLMNPGRSFIRCVEVKNK